MEHKHPDKYLICGKSCGDDKIKRLQATIEELTGAKVRLSTIVDMQSLQNKHLQATIEELQFEHYRGWSSQKLYREEAEAGRATIEELTQGIRDHSDLTHKSNCQTQEGQHGGLNRAYWCSCCLEERKKIESQQATITEQ